MSKILGLFLGYKDGGRRLARQATESFTLEAEKGIVGDKRFGKRARQVNILQARFYDWFEQSFGRRLPLGSAGENVVVSDELDLNWVPVGCRFRMGTAAEPQTWLTDALAYDAAPGQPAGLADLIAGRADFGAVLGRDLSSRLDVVAAGARIDSAEGLPEILAALAETYTFVVAAASDWRSPAARVARVASSVAVLIAPAGRLAGVCDDFAAAFDEAGPVIVGYAIPTISARAEAAA